MVHHDLPPLEERCSDEKVRVTLKHPLHVLPNSLPCGNVNAFFFFFFISPGPSNNAPPYSEVFGNLSAGLTALRSDEKPQRATRLQTTVAPAS
jgi:hypothetical protein